MSNIDLSKMITAEAKVLTAEADLHKALKAECRARIFAVIDATAQINLAAAAAAGALSAEDLTAYRQGLGWINAMRSAVATGEWPVTPAAVTALADRF